MALEELLVAVDAQADAEIDQIRAQAQADADKITTQAQADADAIADASVADIVNKKQALADQDLRKESSTYRRRVADVRREVFEEVFTRSAVKIREIRSSKEYPDILSRLVDDATSGLEGEYVLHVDPLDQQLVAKLFPQTNCVADIKTVGGVVVTSADGRIQRGSTFEDRLDRVHEKYGELVSEVLAS